MATGAERSLPEVFQDIVGNVQEILRSEVRLATAELKHEGGTAARAAVMLLVGVILAIYALGFLLLALVYGLATLFASWWIGAVIVGGGLAVIALAFLGIGRGRMRSVRPAPERTIRTVKENLSWHKSRSK
jgi:uncharacterized membrane protein YqjE